MTSNPNPIETFELLSEQRAVRVDGILQSIGARAFDVLAFLVEHTDRVVSKSELLEHVWADLMVEESNLTVQIANLRKLLGKTSISTVPGVGYKFTLTPGETASVDQSASTSKELRLPVPDKPSLVVLPFTNLTGDPGKDYLVDGIVSDLISALSLISAFFVISSNSSFTLKGSTIDLQETCSKLGVRYALEGSIQQSGAQLRVNMQLVNATTGATFWSRKLSGNDQDIFELQDRLVEEVASALEPNIILAESERSRSKRTEDMQAYDLCMQVSPEVFQALSREGFDSAHKLLKAAIELDPDYIYAKALLVWLHTMASAARWITFEQARSVLPMAEEILENPKCDAIELTFAGHGIAYLDRQQKRGSAALKRAYALNPNSSTVLASSGWVHAYIGETATAINHFKRAIRINPLDPRIGYLRSGVGTAFLVDGRIDKAIEILEQANSEAPEFATTLVQLVLAYWKAGQKETAAKYCAQLLAKMPSMTVSDYYNDTPFLVEPFREEMREILLASGMPE